MNGLPSAALLVQSVVGGLFTGALYGLLGLGLSLSWGLLRQINLSHFALAFIGAYLTYELNERGIDPLAALVVLAPTFFVTGLALQWLMVRFRVNTFNSLLVTFGLAVIVEAALQWVWTADVRKMETHWGDLKFRAGAIFLPATGLIALGLGIALSTGAWLVLQRTSVGKALRAAAQDASMASAFGVNQRRLALLLSGFASALAGVAGVCIALTYTLAPSQIYTWIGVVFACVMLGGLGRPLGPLLAGFVIGISESVTMAVVSPSWAPLVSFSLLILVLLARPWRA